VGGSTSIRGGLGELESAFDVLLCGNPVSVSSMTARAPVEDVGPKPVGRLAEAFRQLERAVEEDGGLADARLLIADDSDLEHDLGPVELARARSDGCARGLLQEPHRLVELAVADPSPGLSLEPSQNPIGTARAGREVACSFERAHGVAVAMPLEEELGLLQRGIQPLAVRAAEPVLQVLAIGREALREPVHRLARRPRLPALDLADVLLREATCGELGLRQARRPPERPYACAQCPGVSRRGCPLLRGHGEMVARSGAGRARTERSPRRPRRSATRRRRAWES